jgi:calcineurin-like phosphoesterase family protein
LEDETIIYLTADLHLGHTNILGYTGRPFHSVGEMNGVLIANIIETVTANDTLYVLGDFAFDPKEYDAYRALLESACRTVFVQGNHDPRKIHAPLMLDFKHNKHHWYVLHYPLLTWRPSTIVCHGHSHGNELSFPEDSRQQWRYDVGVDVVWGGRKYYPVSTDQIEEAMERGTHPTK